MPRAAIDRYFRLVDSLIPDMMSSALSTSVEARQQTRRLKSIFGDAIGAGEAATMLGEVGDVGERVAPILRDIGREISPDKSLVPRARSAPRSARFAGSSARSNAIHASTRRRWNASMSTRASKTRSSFCRIS